MDVIIKKAPNSLYEKDGQNNSALHLAAQIGHTEIVERLLKVYLTDFDLSSWYVKHHIRSKTLLKLHQKCRL